MGRQNSASKELARPVLWRLERWRRWCRIILQTSLNSCRSQLASLRCSESPTYQCWYVRAKSQAIGDADSQELRWIRVQFRQSLDDAAILALIRITSSRVVKEALTRHQAAYYGTTKAGWTQCCPYVKTLGRAVQWAFATSSWAERTWGGENWSWWRSSRGEQIRWYTKENARNYRGRRFRARAMRVSQQHRWPRHEQRIS